MGPESVQPADSSGKEVLSESSNVQKLYEAITITDYKEAFSNCNRLGFRPPGGIDQLVIATNFLMNPKLFTKASELCERAATFQPTPPSPPASTDEMEVNKVNSTVNKTAQPDFDFTSDSSEEVIHLV